MAHFFILGQNSIGRELNSDIFTYFGQNISWNLISGELNFKLILYIELNFLK